LGLTVYSRLTKCLPWIIKIAEHVHRRLKHIFGEIQFLSRLTMRSMIQRFTVRLEILNERRSYTNIVHELRSYWAKCESGSQWGDYDVHHHDDCNINGS